MHLSLLLLSQSLFPNIDASLLARGLRCMQSSDCSQMDPSAEMRTAQSIGEVIPRALGNSILIAIRSGVQNLHPLLLIGLTTYNLGRRYLWTVSYLELSLLLPFHLAVWLFFHRFTSCVRRRCHHLTHGLEGKPSVDITICIC